MGTYRRTGFPRQILSSAGRSTLRLNNLLERLIERLWIVRRPDRLSRFQKALMALGVSQLRLACGLARHDLQF